MSRGAGYWTTVRGEVGVMRLRFRGFPEQWRGPGGEYFHVTLFFETKGGRAMQRFWFISREATRADWNAIKPGDWVTVRGKISSAYATKMYGQTCALFEVEEVDSPTEFVECPNSYTEDIEKN